jgi:hypothetical protein
MGAEYSKRRAASSGIAGAPPNLSPAGSCNKTEKLPLTLRVHNMGALDVIGLPFDGFGDGRIQGSIKAARIAWGSCGNEMSFEITGPW